METQPAGFQMHQSYFCSPFFLIWTIRIPQISLSVLLFSRGVESIDDLMADIAEQHEVAQEISDTISRPIGPGIDFDEVKKMDQAGTDSPYLTKTYRAGTLFLVLEFISFSLFLDFFPTVKQSF